MKMLKKMMSWALALVLVFSAVCGGISVAHAADADLSVKVEKNDTTVSVSILAKGAFSMGGLGAWLNYDKDAFAVEGVYEEDGAEYVEVDSDKLDILAVKADPAHNNDIKISADTGRKKDFTDGEALMTLTFTTTDNFDAAKDYNFTLIVDEFYDNTNTVFTMPSSEITGTLKGEAPAVTYTVKFLDADGNQFGDIVEVEEGKTVAKPEGTPTAPEGKRFAYWALNGKEYDFNTPVTANIELTPVFEEIPTHEFDIKKTVNATVEYPAETFTFEFLDGAYEGPVAGTTAPAIPAVTVTMSGTETEKTVHVNLDEVASLFTAGGTYTYTIKEKAGNTTGWSYDTTHTYQLVIAVEPVLNTNPAELAVSIYTVDGEKTGEPEFVNTYAPNTDLTIKKVVAGNPTPTDGYGTDEFNFTVAFDQAFTGKVIKANGTEETVNFAANNPYSFKLKDGEQIVIKDIPAGAKYTVIEAGAPYYTATAAVVNGEDQSNASGQFGEGVTVGPIEIAAAEEGTNMVTVTNTYSITPPTGVVIHGEMIAIAILVLVAMAGSFILSRKLRRA